MSRLIELHSKATGKRVLINFDEIATMCDGQDGATIYFSENTYAVIKESYDEIMEKLNNVTYENLKKVLNDVNATYIPADNIPDVCKNCSNHPSNGGSGICFCTLGSQGVKY